MAPLGRCAFWGAGVPGTIFSAGGGHVTARAVTVAAPEQQDEKPDDDDENNASEYLDPAWGTGIFGWRVSHAGLRHRVCVRRQEVVYDT